MDNYSNFNSVNSAGEDSMMLAKRQRSHEEGKLYSVLFWMNVVGSPTILILSFIGGIIGGAFSILFGSNAVLYVILGIIGVITLAIGVTIAVMLFKLGQEESCFQAAGIAYIVVALSSTIAEFLPDGLFKSVLNIVEVIAALFYLFEFINGSIHILSGVDNNLAYSWETLKKVYTIIAIVIVVCVVVAFIPFLGVLAALVLVLAALAAIGVLIWEWVLMFKTARALKNF